MTQERIHYNLESDMKTLLGVCVTVSLTDAMLSFQVTRFNPHANEGFTHTSPEVEIDTKNETWMLMRDGRMTSDHPFGELVPQENGMPITYVSVIDPSQVSHREKLEEEFGELGDEEVEYFARSSQGFVATA